MLKPSRNPILKPLLDTAGVERQLKLLPHLTRDRQLSRRTQRIHTRNATKLPSAIAAIEKLPSENESLHLVISGKFALWHTVPAVRKLAGQTIAELRIATLGFSNSNIDELVAMVDAGDINRASLLCSHYFKGTSAPIYQHAQNEFAKRPDRTVFRSLRTHAKMVLIRLSDNRTFVIESSANLRSCGNIEQMTVIANRALYDFHVQWIDELLSASEQ